MKDIRRTTIAEQNTCYLSRAVGLLNKTLLLDRRTDGQTEKREERKKETRKERQNRPVLIS